MSERPPPNQRPRGLRSPLPLSCKAHGTCAERGRGGEASLALALALFLLAWPVVAGTLPAPLNVQVANNDEELAGDAVKVTWQPVTITWPGAAGYRIYIGEDPQKMEAVQVVEGADQREASVKDLQVGHSYYAAVGVVIIPANALLTYDPDDPNEVTTPGAQEAVSAPAGPATTIGRWYKPELTNVLVVSLLLCAITLVVLYMARRRDMYIRPIAALQAVEDAIGRATEMGRPILYVSGLGGAGDIATIASMLILGHLAHKTAPYGTRIIVPVADPMVMATEREIVSQSYLHAGHPEEYNPDNIFFVTDSQFGYATAVAGMILREKPAVNFFMGYFAAESLVLAETGNLTDTLQIAGTDADNQLPFFVAACDYTLMGEELYAAGAYLSRDPILLAQLKAQDVGKVIVGGVILVGVILAATAYYVAPTLRPLAEKLIELLKV